MVFLLAAAMMTAMMTATLVMLHAETAKERNADKSANR
jgi:hypothetical protein